MCFGHRSLNSCNCRRGNFKLANVSQILSRDILGIRLRNDAVVPVSRTFRSKSVDSSMKSRNWPPKGLPLEVTFAPAIAVARCEHAGPVTHVAKREFVYSFVEKYDFTDFYRKFYLAWHRSQKRAWTHTNKSGRRKR